MRHDQVIRRRGCVVDQLTDSINRAPDGGEAMGNSIFVIKPYLWNGMWVFDDPDVGLVREPFVAGVPPMIERATGGIPDAGRGFVAVFSAGYFPDAGVVLEWVREEGGGNVYRWAETGQEGWLCPALLRYFEQAPAKLYIRVRPAAASPAPSADS